MAISDLLITKPGGVTSSEAIAMDLPMLLIDPLPGQEEDNASFLTEAGIAILATSHDDLKHMLNELITNKEKLITMQMKARQLKSSLVSLDILKRYLQLGSMRSIEQLLNDNQGEMVVYAK
jgi:processive 1,2-diacylglycerol beta-glucosyltransferase